MEAGLPVTVRESCALKSRRMRFSLASRDRMALVVRVLMLLLGRLSWSRHVEDDVVVDCYGCGYVILFRYISTVEFVASWKRTSSTDIRSTLHVGSCRPAACMLRRLAHPSHLRSSRMRYSNSNRRAIRHEHEHPAIVARRLAKRN